MNLTFALLERWLEPFHPIATIHEPNLKCEGVRFYPGDTKLDHRFLYISKMDRFFPDSDPREVLLVQKNNIICLFADDLDEVYNRVIEGFEYYTDLKHRLLLAAQSADYEQEISDICSEIFGPTFIIDQTYHFVGISAKYQVGWISPLWDEFLQHRGTTLEHLRMFCDDYLFCNVNRKIKNYAHIQPAAAPFIYSIISTYCDESGTILGQCAISKENKIDDADMELMNWVIEALESSSRKKPAAQGNQFSEIILQAALSRQELTQKDIDILYSMQNWKADSWLCIGVISAAPGTNSSVSSILPYFRQQLPSYLAGIVTVMHEDLLVFCFSLKEKKVSIYDGFVQEKLESLLKLRNCVAGLSLPFRGFHNVHHFLWQAKDVLEKNKRVGQTYMAFSQLAVNSILLHSDYGYALSCIHPAVRMLKDYDDAYHGELIQTLWMFLRANRSYAAVAKQLHIHRNTVLYRLDRIQEIYPLELQDPDTAEYLLLSIRLIRQSN